jgi:aspartate aminotransferase-like enzyme
MGYIDPSDILAGIAALELTLRELGYQFELGAGVKEALKVLSTG